MADLKDNVIPELKNSGDSLSVKNNDPLPPFRGKKEPITEYNNSPSGKIINGIEIISSIQERIVFSDKRITTVYGCAGSRKTDSLCKYGLKQYREKKNILFLTLVSSVTDEIKNRVAKMFDVNLTKAGNHYFGPASKSKQTVEVSTFDAFIYKQLDYMNSSNASIIYDDAILVDESTYKQRMYKLLNSSHDKFVMKNDKFADVVLVDEFQDLETDKIKIIINILKHNPYVKCQVIGDYLQTIFDRSIMVDDILVDHPFELWRKSFINEGSYEEFEINTCYRCPEPQINFINHIIGGTMPRIKYQISDMKSPISNTNNIHKPFIFIHEDIGSNGNENTNGNYIADQAYRIINAIIENDKEERLKRGMSESSGALRLKNAELDSSIQSRELDYSDVTVLMLKSNGQPVFKQLENLMNANDKSKNKFHIHETKGDGYHDRIDWTKSESKSTALSIHGYKGRGNKIILLLGLNNMNMPRKDNINTPKELIDYSLLNVGLSRSQKYLIIGITSSSPTKYFYDRQDTLEDYAYCSWNSNQTLPPVYGAISDAIYGSKWNKGEGNLTRCFKDKMKPGTKHWHVERCKIRRDQLWFDKYFYTDNTIYPKHRIAYVTDGVCDAIDDPEDILIGCTKNQKNQFGNDSEFKIDDYEKKILGVVTEWIINRYLYTVGNDIDLLKYVSFMLAEDSMKMVYYTNNETLLNLIADKELNTFSVHAIYDDELRRSENTIRIWKELITEIKLEHEALLNRDTTGLSLKLHNLSEGLPVMIVHSNFKNDKFLSQLLTLCDKKIANENIDAAIFWNFGLFQMLLFEKIRTPYLSTYYGRMNHNLKTIYDNTHIYCKQLLKHNGSINKQLSHGIRLTVDEDLILGSRTKKKRTKGLPKTTTASDIYDLPYDENQTESVMKSKPFIISGKSDLYIHDEGKIVEIKASSFTDISNAWITQVLTYCCLPLNHILNGKEYSYTPKRFQIVNLLKGISYEFELPANFDRKKCMEIIMKKLKWPPAVINEYFQKY